MEKKQIKNRWKHIAEERRRVQLAYLKVIERCIGGKIEECGDANTVDQKDSK